MQTLDQKFETIPMLMYLCTFAADVTAALASYSATAVARSKALDPKSHPRHVPLYRLLPSQVSLVHSHLTKRYCTRALNTAAVWD